MLQLPDGRAADLVALPQHLDHAIVDIMRGKLPTALAVRCAVLLPERYPVRFVQLGRGGELGALPPLVDAQALLEAQLGCVDEVSQVVFLRPDLYCAAPVAATQLQPVERTLRRLLGLGED
jgi:hypothetical protein